MSEFSPETIADFDPELSNAIQSEAHRQEEHLELIASENYVSPRVLEAQGSILTNKYAEGYPGKRYYGGCEYVDIVEKLAIERACKLFNCQYANVQPHSGSQANSAVYIALLKPGETIMGMNLSEGGHLTHGASVSSSGKIYHSVSYGLDKKTGLIDYQQALEIAQEHKPKLIIAGFSAYSGLVDWKKFRDIADKVGAYLMVDMAHVAGLIAAGCYPSPLEYADVVTSTTHKTLRGPRGGIILSNREPEFTKKFNSAVFPAVQGGPLLHVIAGKAVSFLEAMQPYFIEYQKQTLKNAKILGHVLQERNYTLVGHSIENHLVLINLIGKDYSGKEAEKSLGNANITINKNSVPNDPKSPFLTSGCRLGTPAVTTRGFKEKEIQNIAHWICDILDDIKNTTLQEEIKQKVLKLCAQFPVYEKI